MTERTADARIHTTDWEDVQYRFGNKVGQYVNREEEILKQKAKETESFPVYESTTENIGGSPKDADSSSDELELIRERMRKSRKVSRWSHNHIEETNFANYTRAVTDKSKLRNVLLVIYDNQESGGMKFLDILESLASEELYMMSIVSITAQEARMSLLPVHLPCVVFYSKGKVVHTTYGTTQWGGECMDESTVLEYVTREGFRRLCQEKD
mmetsp:Transcript_10270/g.15447  ORF Transcript_10270/g.15447 Transcript_10270/m.15447 type:complete len:211 (-) Transcript_10270:34-666(-)|eukprot:CAMPEP_0201533936 /NCGR_PEP_ID=MMETSP0161_2-20130828/54778_1 /ASSEMBLY_ACC=CAM_ASM_000251 /TAXON_ID=180227 /ORGANISM="Neoparamoeba aestuarina, Strain SoJaBio B1-5/56/2" /LENGTH=210 /DNA_ID=CAMNT_0047938291 /DNA_START=82 /DNA_END=714 /DNA_ORIENTATION=-